MGKPKELHRTFKISMPTSCLICHYFWTEFQIRLSFHRSCVVRLHGLPDPHFLLPWVCFTSHFWPTLAMTVKIDPRNRWINRTYDSTFANLPTYLLSVMDKTIGSTCCPLHNSPTTMLMENPFGCHRSM